MTTLADVHKILTPEEVLKCELRELESVGPSQVLVQLLAAPINPADINTVEGKYALKPPLPAVGGSEGVGRVTAVGSQVRHLKKGDHVVPLDFGLGTWREAGVFDASAWHPVPPSLPVAAAATMSINPPTALAMLEEFVDLQPGDVVIQNAANSAVGQAVVQAAARRGISTVNLVRERPDSDVLEQSLKRLGGTVVTTEAGLKAALAGAGLPAPALGLNAVGGSASTVVAKTLRPGGTMVTYGGMSLKPVTIPTSLLIFKDLRVRGFWLSGGFACGEAGRQRKAMVLDHVAGLMREGLFQVETRSFPLEEYRHAFEAAQARQKDGKVLLIPSQTTL